MTSARHHAVFLLALGTTQDILRDEEAAFTTLQQALTLWPADDRLLQIITLSHLTRLARRIGKDHDSVRALDQNLNRLKAEEQVTTLPLSTFGHKVNEKIDCARAVVQELHQIWLRLDRSKDIPFLAETHTVLSLRLKRDIAQLKKAIDCCRP